MRHALHLGPIERIKEILQVTFNPFLVFHLVKLNFMRLAKVFYFLFDYNILTPSVLVLVMNNQYAHVVFFLRQQVTDNYRIGKITSAVVERMIGKEDVPRR